MFTTIPHHFSVYVDGAVAGEYESRDEAALSAEGLRELGIKARAIPVGDALHDRYGSRRNFVHVMTDEEHEAVRSCVEDLDADDREESDGEDDEAIINDTLRGAR